MPTTLQHIVLSKTDSSNYRLYSDKEMKDNPVYIPAGGSISLGGFINNFSLTKWRKYTVFDDLHVNINVTGKYHIKVVCHTSIDQETLIEQQNTGSCDLLIPYKKKGLLSICIRAVTDISIQSGCYYTNSPPINDVCLGIIVCTFKRNAYIKNKIDTFLQSLDFEDMYSKLELFIIDNACELNNSLAVQGHIHIIHNENVGGSGGFSRGICELNKIGKFTHAILMDDDTITEPECFYRTWSFLSMINGDYKQSVIGGAMLLMDQKTIVYEATNLFSEDTDSVYRCHPQKNNLDVSDVRGCLEYDVETIGNYNGWWYCVYPLSFARLDNLPLQLFMKYDDVEYGIRFGKTPILLNGIFSWHENFERKKTPITEYYNLRNRLYLMKKYNSVNKKYIRKKIEYATLQIIRGQKKDGMVILEAIKDYNQMPKKWMHNELKVLAPFKRIRAIRLIIELFITNTFNRQ